MKIAIVHDYLNQFGGAERVVAALHEIYPEAPIFTSIYNERAMPDPFRSMDVRTSFMQKLPFIFRFFKLYFLVYPFAFEKFDLNGYDLILSSSSAYAKGVKKLPGQVHICYCHTPMRFVWRFKEYMEHERLPGLLLGILRYLLKPVQEWDLRTAGEVDHFIANSRTVAKRIDRIYGRESVIINPPVETELFRPAEVDGDYFLVVSRLNSYKRVDLAVAACTKLDLPLKIAGGGPELKNLKKLAGPNVEFLGRVPDERLNQLLAECRALIFPGEEDFGIVPLEAMACGRPVIAFYGGGARETVVQGQTGLFFKEQNVESLMEALKKSQFMSFDKMLIRRRAEEFSKEIFQRKMREFIEEKTR